MDEPPRSSPDSPPPRPRLPWVLVAIATAVAVLAVTGFLYLLTKRSDGPGQVLREFLVAAHNGDCEGSYAWLTDARRADVSRDEWCGRLGRFEWPVSFRVEEIVLQGDVAEVTIETPDSSTQRWSLERLGRSWRVSGAEGRLPGG